MNPPKIVPREPATVDNQLDLIEYIESLVRKGKTMEDKELKALGTCFGEERIAKIVDDVDALVREEQFK